MSDAHKKKIAESCKGKVVSEETRKKLSKANKGKKISNEQKISHSIKMKANSPKYDFNGEMLSMYDAAEKYKINVNTLKSRIRVRKAPNNIAILNIKDWKKYLINKRKK